MERVPVAADPRRFDRRRPIHGANRSSRQTSLSFVIATVLAAVLARAEVASAEERNRCGCYRDTTGACFCEKKATCGCPGDCEPRGCEEKRDRELQKQIQEETKRAQAAGRKGSASKDEESETATAPTKRAPPPAHQKLTPAQAKQLVRLIDLYLSGHPGAGGRPIEEVSKDLTPTR
jgi:hypothetical protein